MNTYVLDTSVLVHDPHSLSKFDDNRVAIPIFVVMELDVLKDKDRLSVSASARMASRFLSDLMQHGDLYSEEGVTHPDTGTNYRIVSHVAGIRALEEAENTKKMDRLIIEAAASLKEPNVVLVTKDVNMRIMAMSEGLMTEDYRNDRVVHTGFVGYQTCEDWEHASELLREGSIRPSDFDLEMVENEFLVFPSTERIFRYFKEDDELVEIPECPLRGIKPKNRDQRMAISLLMDPDISLVTLIGKSGTGKTILALASALAQIGDGEGQYSRIVLSKPVIEMGQGIGFLPGTFEEKMAPWMMSYFDNLDQLIPSRSKKAERNWEQLMHSKQIEVQAMSTIRGRSIAKSYLIVDEVQNCTPHEIKTLVTRAAKGTKVVLLGDPQQIDTPRLDQRSNGLVYIADRMRDLPEVGSVTLTKGERSPLAELAATRL